MLKQLFAGAVAASLLAFSPVPDVTRNEVGPIDDANGTEYNTTTRVVNWPHAQVSGVEFDIHWASIYIDTSAAFGRDFGDDTAVGHVVSGWVHAVTPKSGVTWEDIGNGSSSLTYKAEQIP